MIALTTVTLAASPPIAQAVYHIDSIKAFHYYPETGHFDQRDLVSPPPYFVVRNAFIGEGDAESPTATTLVFVEVAGPHFYSGTKGKVTLKARMDGRVLLTQTVSLEVFFSERTSIIVPFLVHGTACGKLDLTACLSTETRTRDSRTEMISFRCAE